MQIAIKNYPDYMYDDVAGAVISYKRGYPYRLTWLGADKTVTLFNFTPLGLQKRTFTAAEIMTMLETPEETMNGDEVMEEYIIGTRNGANFSFSATPRVHPNEKEAKAEAERLAKSNPGKRFVVVKLVGSVVASGVNWS